MNRHAEVVEINYEKYGQQIILKPISDIHFGSRHCDVPALKKFLGKPNKDTYYIGLGDWLDSIVVLDKRYRKSADGTPGEIDEIIDAQVDSLYKIMEPFKGQIVGLGTGNHEDTITKRCGTNPAKRIAKKLECPYLGYSFLLKILLSQNKNRSRTVIIRGHHGWGGGSRTQGADLTKYSRDLNYFEADLFLYGHVHKLQHDTVPRLSLMGNKLISKPKHICICGTFLKTYSDSTDATYSEVCGYPPVPLGGLEIAMRPVNDWMDIEVSSMRAAL